MPLTADRLPLIPRVVTSVPETQQANRALIRWLVIIVACAFGTLGAWYFAEVAIKHRAWELLLREGTVTKAKFTRVVIEGKGIPLKQRMWLMYRFRCSESEHEAMSSTQPTPNLPRVGDVFVITYLPSQPATHVMGDVTLGESNLQETSFHYENEMIVGFFGVLCFFAMVMALVIGFFLVWMVFARWQATRHEEELARNGIAHDALITSSLPDTSVPTLYKVAYRFQLATGSVVTGSTYIQKSTVEAEGYRAGATLSVLYDANQPTSHILLRDLSFVEIVFT